MIDYAQKYKILRQHLGLSQAEFAIKTGTSRSIISQIEIGKLRPSLENIANTSHAFNVSLNYFFKSNKNLDEENYLLYNLVPAYVVQEPTAVHSNLKSEVLFVPVKARASYIAGIADKNYIKQFEYYNIPGCPNSNFRIFEVEGFSMQPSLNNGDLVIGEKLQNISCIKRDFIYIIISLSAGVLIKRAFKTELNGNQELLKLQLTVDNPDKVSYPLIELTSSDIAEAWQFHMLITKQTVEPDKILGRLSGIEYKIESIRQQLEKR